MEAFIFPICAFKDNYIWTLVDVDQRQAWVVDPGDAKAVINVFTEKGLNLKGILLTHHHWDHTDGVAELNARYGPLKIIGSSLTSISSVNHFVREDDEIQCLSWSLKTMEIPGHTKDHLGYYNEKILFCGDTLFSVGCGKIFEGNPPQMYQSLQKIKNLSAQTKIYCGHEYTLANLLFAKTVDPENPAITAKINYVKQQLAQNLSTIPSTLNEEKIINPFLRCEEAAIIRSVEKYTGKKLVDPIEVFAHLREWKNNFISL